MKAKEMFENCGFYEADEGEKDYILYEKSTLKNHYQIFFSLKAGCVDFRAFSVRTFYNAEFDVYPHVLKAVFQQCKELGWL